MKNMEQLRSKNALQAAADKPFEGRNEGDIIKKVPTMIQQNGFLGALAFAIEDEARIAKQKKEHGNGTDKESGYARAFQAILKHLQSPDVAICPKEIGSLLGFAKWLCADDRDSVELRMVTAEAMAYMNVLRRFAK